ncbi:MAG: hypothetical protein APF80_04800 [Alphaproteobacteria bacterium BRH_c36]|nr:MAG: hypothetical protein APF80_04800 [Alphaproteobacteria bacterium BRH_c36]
MASKKFRNKTCAYCGVPGASATGDHVFAREFFLVRHRANLPQVPACASCNSEKSRLETYLLQIMPLGANHPEAQETIQTLMPKRAAHRANKVLHDVIDNSRETVWLTVQTGQQHERIPVYLDADRLRSWCGLVGRGLAFFHWGVVTPDYKVEAIPLAPKVEHDILAMARRYKGGEYAEGSVGNGAFAYRGFKCADGEPASIWMINMYGRMPIGGDPAVSRVCANSFGVFITPRGHHEVAW